jgi:hypothetical protein
MLAVQQALSPYSREQEAKSYTQMGRKAGTAAPPQKRRVRVERRPRGKKDSDKDEVEDDDITNDDIVELKSIADLSHTESCDKCEVKGAKCTHIDKMRRCWVGTGGLYVYNDEGTRIGISYNNQTFFFAK